MAKASRFTVTFLLVIMAGFILAGYAFAEKKPSIIWKTGTLAPKGVGYANQVRDIIIPAIAEATDGEVLLKIYWGGVMGDDKQHLKKMRIGQLQAGGLSGQGTFMLAPDIAVLGLPFLFNDYDEVDYVKHEMLPVFDKIVAQEGFRLLVWLDQDFDQIYSVKTPVTRPSDFPKAKFVTWFGPLEGKLLQMLGTTPSPFDITEIPSSLRSGVVNAMIAPSIWVVGTQLYSTFKYVNPIKIRYVPAFAVCTVKAWNKLPKKFQKNIYNKREGWATTFTKDSRKEGDKCFAAMVRYGVKEKRSTKKELLEIKAKSLPIWNRLAGSLYSKALLDEIKGHLADYRKNKE